MMMNKIYYLLICLLLFACSKEADLTPSGIKEDFFTEPSYASPEDLQLINKFYSDHGVHLLFNDTLRHEQRGTYADGTPRWFTETVDFAYSLTSTSGTYRFTYLENQANKALAIQLTENNILSHLGEGMKPYSILLLSTLESYNSYWETWSSLNYVNGYRCLALNVGKLLSLDEEDRVPASMAILENMLASLLTSNLLKPFTDPVEKYYDAYWGDGYAEFYDDFKERKKKYRDLDNEAYYAENDYYDAADAYDAAQEAFENGEITEEELEEAENAMNEAEEVYNAKQAEYDEYLTEWRAYCKQIAHECGFIWFNNSGSIRSEDYDKTDYIKAILYTDEEEFMETYKNYPLVRERYNTLKKIIIDLGFTF